MAVTDEQRIADLLACARLSDAAAGPPVGGGTSARVRRIDRDDGPVAVAKLAVPGLPSRRVDAEAHVLGVLGPRAELPTPRLLARVGDDLLLECVAPSAPGSDPPAGASPPEALAAAARVHAAALEPEDRGLLAPWGRGTDGAAAPFARRARRVARRTHGFLALLPGPRRTAWRRRLDRVAAGFERACTRLASLPGGLIHGDLHPGHALAAAGGAVLVDWQHASVGPPAVDVVRLLLEHPDVGPEDGERLAARHLGDLDPAVLDDVVLVTIGGLVAGFGGRAPGDLAAWERAIVDHATDPGGWAARRLAPTGPRRRERG